MRSKIPASLVSLSLAFLAWAGAKAQTVDDFFHGGAQSYLSNNIPGALTVVTNGLQRFPDDQKLQKLYELLNQKQQQQQQQQDQKEQEQKEQQQDQGKKDQQEQSKNEQQKKEEQKPQEEQKSGDDKSKGQPDEKKEAGEPQQARAMTPQEAKQLLDAQKGEEQVLQFRPQAEPKNRGKKLNDW